MTRRNFTQRQRIAVFDRANGRCQGKDCGVVLKPGAWQCDHIIADSNGGEPTIENAQALCLECHARKTATEDTPRAAKIVRQRAAHIGAKVKSRGFTPAEKQMRASRPVEKLANLGRKPLYERTDNG